MSTARALDRIGDPDAPGVYWEAGLYAFGTDPLTDLGASEYVGGGYARQSLTFGAAVEGVGSSTIASDMDLAFDDLPAGVCGGVFIVADGTDDVLCTCAFTSGLETPEGSSLRVASGALIVDLSA